jgi:hypothetical protein
MKTKIKEIISKIKHICSNANYKIRYNNLVKKYENLENEYAKLEKKLSAEYLNSQLNQARKEASMYKKQRDLVRQDYIDLQNSITNKEN